MSIVKTMRVRETLTAALPYLADVGRVAYVSSCVVILATAAAEFFFPGVIANFVAPQMLVGLAFLAGALSLAAPSLERSPPRAAAYAAVGAISAVFAFSAAWYYFIPVPEAQAPLAWAAGGIVALLFSAYRHPVKKNL